MPKAGQSMTEGKIVTWLKKEGDAVGEGDPLLEIETDKANLEVEAQEGGVLRRIFVAEGDVCPVLAPIGVIGGADEEIDFDALRERAAPAPQATELGTPGPAPAPPPAGASRETPGSPPGAPAPRAPAAPPPASRPVPSPAGGGAPAAAPLSLVPRAPAPPRRGGRRVHASPLARRLAAARGVDLANLRGSGPNGRILKRDVETAPASAATDGGGGLSVPGPAAPYPPPSPRPPAHLPLEGMRRAIASALQQSTSTKPHFYTTAAVDMTAALALKAVRANEGVRLTVNDLILRACTLALCDEPRVNCRVFDDHIEYPEDIHLGVAVGTDEGLVVPVILRAQEYDLEGMARESRRIIELAQQGKLVGSGQGTFTVSNLGMFAVDSFTAIINPPEGAILAVGAALEQLVPAGGGFFPRPVMKITISSDHRAIDGLLAARFLVRVRHWLESGQL
jgi:pyruvate dehydrogenase E2 component (dihydrolipoamide acetyltransferase)